MVFSCDLLKNSYLCLLNNTEETEENKDKQVVICWKIRIFAYWTTPRFHTVDKRISCDLLKNSYLCLLNNTRWRSRYTRSPVVICWKIRIFAYWTTPDRIQNLRVYMLWFAEKFVSLLIEQHPMSMSWHEGNSCDLLKNSYLCLLNNTPFPPSSCGGLVVICWKIRIFAYWTTPVIQE